MAKKTLVPGSTLLPPGADVYSRKALKFVFTCETFSDRSQKTIFASVRITNNGEVNVCDYEVIKGEFPCMDQDTAMLFQGDVDEGTVEGFCLADDDSPTQ
jgi:hypothetical protein